MARKKTPPLHQAAKDGDLEKLQAALEKKWWRAAPDIDAGDEWGCSALHYAVEGNDESLAAWLIQNGADVNAVNRFGHIPLHNAARHGKTGMIELLLANGAQIDAAAGEDNTALQWAAKQGHLEATKLLLRRGANKGVKNKDGQIALEIAQAIKREDLAQVLS